MSSLYLLRHGQAGTRGAYDSLSELGERQARLLGEHLAAQKIEFQAFITGSMNRQRQTALAVRQAYQDADIPAPEVVCDPRWNEFDMAGVFAEFSQLLCESDPEFKQEYDDLNRKLQDAASPVHRAWTDCDTQCMRAWMEDRFRCRVESWSAFRARILQCCAALSAYQAGEAVAVFTSALPVATLTASSLDVADRYVMRVAGVIYNTAINTFRLRDGEVTLFSFNGTPHLTEAALRTFR